MTTIIRRYDIDGTNTKLILNAHWQDFKGNESPYLSIDCRVVVNSKALEGDQLENALSHIKDVDSYIKTLLDNQSSYKDRGYHCHFIANSLHKVNTYREFMANPVRSKDEVWIAADKLYTSYCEDYERDFKDDPWDIDILPKDVNIEDIFTNIYGFGLIFHQHWPKFESDEQRFLHIICDWTHGRHRFNEGDLVPQLQSKYNKSYTAICDMLNTIEQHYDECAKAPDHPGATQLHILKESLHIDDDDLLDKIISSVTTEKDLYEILDSCKPFDVNLVQLIEVTEQLGIETKTK